MSDFSEIGAELERAGEGLDRRIRAVMDDALRETLDLARVYSSAPPLTPAERKEAPFARRHGAAQMEADIIHLGSGPTQGNFAGAWQGEITDGGWSLHIWNDDEAAQYLEPGTETMFARPIAERIEKEMGEEVERKASDVFSDLFRGG